MTTRRALRVRKARTARARKMTPEGYVALQVTDYLTAHRIRYVRNNVVRGRIVGGGYIDTGHKKGTADYTAYVAVPGHGNCRWVVHIETKRPKDAVHAQQQKDWRDQVLACGEFYILAQSYEPVEAWLKEKGIL